MLLHFIFQTMKKILTIVMSLIAMASYAQDVIVKNDGSTIVSKIVEIGTSDVKYKKWDNLDGPIYTISKKELSSLNYQNGTKESFEDENLSQRPKSTTGFIELNPSIGLSKGTKGSLEMKVGFLKNINDYLKWGLGTGVQESYSFDETPSIPAFLRLEYQGEDSGKGSMFCHMDAGYSFNLEDFDYGAIELNPTFGYYFKNIYLGLGYLGVIPTGNGSAVHGINFKFGYRFGGSGSSNVKFTKLAKFFKQTKFTASVGGALGMTKVEEEGYKSKTVGTGYGADFAWTYKCTDRLDLGIGTGIRVHEMTNWFKYSTSEVITHNTIVVPLFARGEYVLSEKNNTFEPFVRADVGYLLGTTEDSEAEEGLYIQPQIGVKYKKLFASFGIEYRTVDMDYFGENIKSGDKMFTPVINLGVEL